MSLTSSNKLAATATGKVTVTLAVHAERQATFAVLDAVVKLVGGMVGPNVEVVLHDLLMPERSIVAIANGHVSKRAVGYPILSGPKIDLGFHAAVETLATQGAAHSVTTGYTTMTEGGQPLHSGTVTFRDSAGIPFAALCLNADLTVVAMMHGWLERMMVGQRELVPVPALDAPPELDVLANEIIAEAVALLGKPLSLMTRVDKVHAVNAMMERGLFMVKGGVEMAAAALGVTRFTIYNYLEELRERSGAISPSAASKPTAQVARTRSRRKSGPGAPG